MGMVYRQGMWKRRDSVDAGNGLPEPPSDILDASRPYSSLYRIAYEEGRKSLSDQVDELNGMRNRAVSYMAFILSATAFLVGTTLRTASPGALFYATAVIASALTIWAIVHLALTIWPRVDFIFQLDPSGIVTDFIDRDIPRPTEAELLRSLSGWISVYLEANEKALKKIRYRFTNVVISGALGLLIWTLMAWFFSRVGTGA